MTEHIGIKYTKAIQALQDIHALSIDYDGFRSPPSLMELIDELREIAKKGIDGKYTEEDLKGCGYIHEDDPAEGWVVEVYACNNSTTPPSEQECEKKLQGYDVDCDACPANTFFPSEPHIRPATVKERLALDGKTVKA